VAGRWSVEQVEALAPDAASVAAARRLSGWTDLGACAGLVWGGCPGSGAAPYRVAVDLEGPAYRCDCPSRKFPCKHALGLLLLWAAGGVPEAAEPVERAAAWRHERESGAATPRTGAARDEEAAARRAEQREARVTAGLAELEIWLRDQVRSGFGSSGGYGQIGRMAARMVDAQAPGVAGVLRRLGGTAASGDGWPDRLLSGYAQLHLLVRAHQRLAELPADLAAVVRSRVGYPVGKQDVLATDAVTDRWLVTGTRDNLDGTVPARRVWLRGEASGRDALLLLFEPNAMFAKVAGGDLGTGLAVPADVHFYPGMPLRALVGERHAEPAPGAEPAAGDLAHLLDSVAAAMALDPWLGEWPFSVRGVPVPTGGGWLLADESGRTLPLLTGGEPAWTLAAVSGGAPVTVTGEWTPAGLVPLTSWHAGRAVRL
jgi:SWIM zinc finger